VYLAKNYLPRRNIVKKEKNLLLLMSHPRSMLITRPPLRKMMCTDMGIRYENAALFSNEIR
jgi:hypothetical protein